MSQLGFLNQSNHSTEKRLVLQQSKLTVQVQAALIISFV